MVAEGEQLCEVARNGDVEKVRALIDSGAGRCSHQDAFEVLLNAGIFFDTYGEYYENVREFHQHLPKLLKPGGICSSFTGLCGGSAFFHLVYCHLVSLELENLGHLTQLIPLPVKDCLGEEVGQGVRHKYWLLDMYYLPVCQSLQEFE
ncbi:hypothetical protein SLA2020_143160 [Shorea laevis]